MLQWNHQLVMGLSLLKLVDSTTHGKGRDDRKLPPLVCTMYKLNSGPSPPPSGYCNGGCVIIMNDLFAFGGWNGPTPYNDLHKLNLTTFQWNKFTPKLIHLKCLFARVPVVSLQ